MLRIFTKIFAIILLICKIRCDFEWMYYIKYGENVKLKPLKRNETDGIEITKCVWKTPSFNDLLASQVNDEPNSRYFIDEDACELTIFNIQADTNGIYHSIINDIYISKA